VDQQEILSKLGLDRPPTGRYEVGVPHSQPSGSQLLNFKKALQLVDPIETASFGRYIPNDLVIDQSIDTRVFDPENSKMVPIRTDLPIPSGPKVYRATGIGSEPNAHNHYLWLAQELRRHVIELGARATSPPLIFRTHGYGGTVPLLGAMFTLDTRPPTGLTKDDIGANWALLAPKAPQVHLDEDESPEDVK
jgi:hypothetical protein